MKFSRLEIALAVGIALVWAWAAILTFGLKELRGPFSRPEHASGAELLEEFSRLTAPPAETN
jgi:hypothetical protein